MRSMWKWAGLAMILAASPEAALAASPGVYGGAGINAEGELGSGNNTASTTPNAVNSTAPSPIDGKTLVQVSAGFNHACAVDSDGNAYCWGNNSKGQLGNNTVTASNTPVLVSTATSLNGKRVKAIRAGYLATCAIDTLGGAHCWGYNNQGQLGIGSTTDTLQPAQLAISGVNLANTLSISVSENHGCAVANGTTTSGNVYCWGKNFSGQLGTGNNTDSTTPVAISTACTNAAVSSGTSISTSNTSAASGRTFIDIRAGKVGNNTGTTCATSLDGRAICWGSNNLDTLGLGPASGGGNNPASVNCPSFVYTGTTGAVSDLAGKTVTSVALGAGSNPGMGCAVTDTGAASCWGNQNKGQLGDGVLTNTTTPTPVAVKLSTVAPGKKFSKISIGTDHACGLTTEGLAYCWGANTSGEFGNNNTTSVTATNPLLLAATGTAGSASFTGTAITDVSTGNDFTLFLAPAGGPGKPLPAGQWQMMSLPCSMASANNTPPNQFGTSTPTNWNSSCYANNAGGCAASAWTIKSFTKSNNGSTGTFQYATVGSTTALEHATGTAGYWLYNTVTPAAGRMFANCNPGQSKPNPTYTQAQAPACTSASGCYAIPVSTNWAGNTYNLVPNPLPFAVQWSQVRLCVGPTISGGTLSCANAYSPCQAAGGGGSCTGTAAVTPVMSNTISIWNGTSYSDYNDLSPSNGNLGYFQSFWVNVLPGAGQGSTMYLLIPAAPTSGTAVALAPAQAKAGSTSTSSKVTIPLPPLPTNASTWTVDLKVYDYQRNMSHNNTTIGRLANGIDGNDPLDIPRTPPFSSPYLYASVTHTDWGTKSGDYATDIRKPVKQAQTDWRFKISTDVAGGTVRLKWQASNLGILSKCQLIDADTSKSYSPGSSNFVTDGINVAMTSSTRNFIWRCKGI